MSKPSTTNCPKAFAKVQCFSCSVPLYSYCLCAIVIMLAKSINDILGGYCGGVPPLPIPNREVKPTCADGTAMQCGRVGNRLLSVRASRTKVFGALFVYIYFISSYTLLYIYILLYIRLFPFPLSLFTLLLFTFSLSHNIFVSFPFLYYYGQYKG